MAYDAFISYSHGADLDLGPVVRDGLRRLAKPWNRQRALVLPPHSDVVSRAR